MPFDSSAADRHQQLEQRIEDALPAIRSYWQLQSAPTAGVTFLAVRALCGVFIALAYIVSRRYDRPD